LKEELVSFVSFGFEKLGEFPLVEGSFRNLIEIYLPEGLSSFDYKNLHVLFVFIVVLFLIDCGIVSNFAERNEQELKQRSNYGKLKKY